MLSLFRTKRGDDREREPLLPRHHNRDTALQASLDKKLHTYQMLRAISHGYMPSNEQLIVYLRHTVDILGTVPPDASSSGKALIRNMRQLLEHLILFLQNKNGSDQIQDFVWYIAGARLSVDTEDLGERVQAIHPTADIAYTSLSVVSSLLLTNSDFRMFLGDVTTIGREVFRDVAHTLSTVSSQVGKQVAPSREEAAAVKHPNGESQQPPSSKDFQDDAAEISSAVAQGAGEVAEEAGASLREHISKEERETLLTRLRQAALNLRQKRDYTDSISTLSLVLRWYLKAYFQALSEVAEGAEEAIGRNDETDRALRNLWGFITSLGDPRLWRDVELAFKAVMDTCQGDPEFGKHIDRVGDLIQAMFTDPDFYDNAEQRFGKLRDEFQELTTESHIRDDIDTLLTSIRLACCSISEDNDIRNVNDDSKRILNVLLPANKNINKELVSDCINTLIPLLINAVQYIPIPRLEISTPELDLLLENLILEPGETMNRSSFLPYQMKFSTLNNVEILKGRARTTSSMSTFVRVKLSGISVSASDIGYWIRCHSGLLRFGSEGIASMWLDQRGIDVVLDLEIGRDRIDELISVRHVGVRIHRFNYTLGKSKLSWLAWLVKPLLRPLIRITMETQIANAIKNACETVNRELLFARERLRATRIADPNDVWTFIRAVSARMTAPRQDADRSARIGVDEPGTGVFEGVYAPGSLVRVWNEEGTLAGEREILKKHGVKKLDTAQVYGNSEERIGRTEGGSTHGFTIDIKWGGGYLELVKGEDLKNALGSIREAVFTSAEKSIQDLRISQVDVFYIHAPVKDVPLEDILAGINDAYEAGLFRRFGISNYPPAEVQRLYDTAKSHGSSNILLL